MRIRTLTALALIAVLAMAVGCSRQRTYVAPGGSVTVNEKGGEAKTVEVNTEQGKATIDVGKKSISEKELGAPVYPGSTVEVTGNYQGAGGNQAQQMQHTVLTTSDSYDKVYEFYKKNLKNVKNSLNQDMGTGKMAMLSAESGGAEITVQITTDKDKNLTRIMVMKMAKKK